MGWGGTFLPPLLTFVLTLESRTFSVFVDWAPGGPLHQVPCTLQPVGVGRGQACPSRIPSHSPPSHGGGLALRTGHCSGAASIPGPSRRGPSVLGRAVPAASCAQGPGYRPLVGEMTGPPSTLLLPCPPTAGRGTRASNRAEVRTATPPPHEPHLGRPSPLAACFPDGGRQGPAGLSSTKA